MDGRADQYALGVVAFEMLAGRRPFETVRVQDLLKLHLSAEVPELSALRPGLEPSVDAAVRRALAKYPSDRFPTATAFVETLAGRRPVAVAQGGRATRSTLATPRVVPSPASAGGGAATVLLVTLLVTAAGIGAAALAPATRPMVLEGWQVARGAVAAIVPGLSSPSRAAPPTVAPPAAAPGPAPASVAAESGATPMYGATGGSDSGGVATDSAPAPAPVRERAPIGLDPALLGSARPAAAPAPAAYGMPGYVLVTTRGGSARVRVDGQRYGFTPQLLRIDAGRHVVTVEGAGDAFLPSQLTVEVAAGDTAAAVFTAPGWGRPRPEEGAAAAAPSAPPAPGAHPATDSGATPPR